METDTTLLQRWHNQRDQHAFAILAERYAALIFATCRRVTGDHHAAEDITQNVLLALARQRQTIRKSLASYLHRTAHNHALNHLRSRDRRQHHETKAPASRTTEGNGYLWRDIEPHLDAALTALPDDQRAIVIRHFLLGQDQAEIADTLAISQATVSRRITVGLENLRKQLSRTGCIVTIAALSTQLSANCRETVSSNLLASIPKITLTGTVMPAASTWSPLWLSSIVAGSCAIILITTFFSSTEQEETSISNSPAVAESVIDYGTKTRDSVR